MNGIIIINKEKGYTSNDVVQIVRHTLNEKVGHAGTLDPNATGVLPLLIGKGTKISKYLIKHDKTYEAILQLGIRTDTGDGEGKVLKKVEVKKSILSNNNLNNVLSSFIGKQMQTPPIYSAIKINGKKLYNYARSGEKVEIPERNIEIYKMKLQKIDIDNNQVQFRVECSKGTYIRTLCEDIAKKLGTIGYMKELKRIQVGEFNIENSLKIEELERNKQNKEFLKQHIISIEDILKNVGKVILNDRQLKLFLNGVKISESYEDGVYKIYDERGKFIGTGIAKDKKVKRDIIL